MNADDHEVRIEPSDYRIRGKLQKGFWDVRCSGCQTVSGPLTEAEAGAWHHGHNAAIRALSPPPPTEPLRFIVMNRGAAWTVYDNQRHMDIWLFPSEKTALWWCAGANAIEGPPEDRQYLKEQP